ncbi:MAG: AAA family ATPase [Pseudonocardia sp.]
MLVLVQRAYIPGCPEAAEMWPLSVPAIAAIAARGLTFERSITLLVGENGSGKSTVVEALAEAYGLDARGGRAGRKYGNARPKTKLGELLRVETTAVGARMRSGPRSKNKGYFLRAETAFGFMEAVRGMQGYWADDTSTMSHGEGFLTVLDAMFDGPGFYVLDEPEAALSFTSCLRLVALMDHLAGLGGQVVCATHSPLLAATPGAEIVELGDHGYRRVKWDELQLVDQWRRFFADPSFYF